MSVASTRTRTFPVAGSELNSSEYIHVLSGPTATTFVGGPGKVGNCTSTSTSSVRVQDSGLNTSTLTPSDFTSEAMLLSPVWMMSRSMRAATAYLRVAST